MSKVIITSQKLVDLADAVRTHNSISDKLKLPDIPGMVNKSPEYPFVGTFNIADGIALNSWDTFFIGVKSKEYRRLYSEPEYDAMQTPYNERMYYNRLLKLYSSDGNLLHNEDRYNSSGGNLFDGGGQFKPGPVDWEAFKALGQNAYDEYDYTAEVAPDNDGYYVYPFLPYPTYVNTQNIFYRNGKYFFDDGMTSDDINYVNNLIQNCYAEFIKDSSQND